jgi:1,4-dihydroxy-2-naphthoate octaprenyltransferase
VSHPATAPAPGSIGAWVLASRPKTLTAAIVPVVVGSGVAAAAGGFRAGPALAALFGALMLQIGTNLANDVFDFETGADDEHRLGPPRAAQAGLLGPSQLKRGMAVAFALATAAGGYLAWVGGWPIVAIGLASIASGIAYTGGPYPLGYHGLGDVFVLVFFGFVAVCGTAYVQLAAVPALAWWASIPVGALATAVLVVNNVRDRETDLRAGKRTLAVRFGRVAGLTEYAVLLVAAYAIPVALYATGRTGAWGLLPLVSSPLAAIELRGVIASTGGALNRHLAGTARLLLVHGALFGLGLGLGG